MQCWEVGDKHMAKDEALKLALEVLENLPGYRADIDNAITAIKEVLEKNT